MLLLLCLIPTFIHSVVSSLPKMNNSIQIDEISGPHILGEGPHWDADRQCLYYVDIVNSTVFRYVPSEKRVTSCKVEQAEHVSIVIPVKTTSDKFIISMGIRLALMTWDGESTTPSDIKVLTSISSEAQGNKFNDGKVDTTGRLWVGTMIEQKNMVEDFGKANPLSSLYSFAKTLQATRRESNITIANGLTWSPDHKVMYFIDTQKKTVDGYDFDASTGEIKNRRMIYNFTQPDVTVKIYGPDGMTIDSEGNLWVAVFGVDVGGIHNIDPRTGKLLRVVKIPTSPLPTSVAFGGTNLDELFVVTANFTFLESDKFPTAGKTFRVTGLGVRGVPMIPVDLDKSLI